MRFASINHSVIQITIAHFHIYMKIGLIREACVVQTAVFEVAIFKVDFARCQKFTEVNYLLLKIAIEKVKTLLMTQNCNTSQIKVVDCYYRQVFLYCYQMFKLELCQSLSAHFDLVLETFHLVE